MKLKDIIKKRETLMENIVALVAEHRKYESNSWVAKMIVKEIEHIQQELETLENHEWVCKNPIC